MFLIHILLRFLKQPAWRKHIQPCSSNMLNSLGKAVKAPGLGRAGERPKGGGGGIFQG